MSAPHTPRRSGRQRKSNALHDDQVAWNDDTLRLLRAESDSASNSSDSSSPGSVRKLDDVDFDTEVQDEEAPDIDEGEDDDEGSGRAPSPSASTPSVGTPAPESRGLDLGRRQDGVRPITHRRQKPSEAAKEQGLRSRMLQRGHDKLRFPIAEVYTESFGPELADQYPMLRSRDIWYLNSRDVVLPSRASIKEVVQLHIQGKYLAWKPPDKSVESGGDENTQAQQLRNGRSTNQVVNQISISEATSRMYIKNDVKNTAILGPFHASQKYELKTLEPLNIADAYAASFVKSTKIHGAPAPRNQPAEVQNISHRGWLLNLGARVQSMAWAPGDSDNQYLAISFKSTQSQRDVVPPLPSNISPAFSPSSDYPSHIQILRLRAMSNNNNEPARLSEKQGAPHLHQVLCTNWGDNLKLGWLPLPIDPSTTPFEHTLVVLATNGCVRLVKTDLNNASVQVIERPDLIARPSEHTILTCFCVPSCEDLIVGDAAGAVHLYNLNVATPDGVLTAYTTIQVHHTYIMALVVAADYPHFLCSQSAAGEQILTDLRNPDQDRAVVRKTRLPTRNLTYYPFTRTFITTSDAAGNSEPTGTSLSMVQGHNLRHFYQTNALLKLPEVSGIMTVLATSPFHPIILAANASGSVFASNVMRRMMPTAYKFFDERGATWQVKLYDVDWKEQPAETEPRVSGDTMEMDKQTSGNMAGDLDINSAASPVETNNPPAPPSTQIVSPSSAPVDIYHGPPTRRGLFRIHEGFKPERAELGNFGFFRSSRNKRTKIGQTPAAVSQIILPEEQAVTAMCWNPNPRFSGWAAIGWGGGCVVIRDLSHDVV